MKYERKDRNLILFISKSYENICVIDFLKELIPSKKLIHLLFQHHQIQLNGTLAHHQDQLKEDDQLTLYAYQDHLNQKDVNVLPDVIYEDDFLIALNKPVPLLVYDVDNKQENTLSNQLAHYYKINHIDLAVRPIHRIDVDTSGVILYSKCSLLQPLFDSMIADKKIKRTYVAIVNGEMKIGKKDCIEANIGSDRHHAKKMCINKSGKWAKTNYEVIFSRKQENLSILKVNLESGRTHQIRIHMMHIHHPILGDPLYGNRSFQRLALHASQLEFFHPILETNIKITAPLPDVMNEMIK